MKLIYLSIAWVAGIYLGSLVSPPLYILFPAFALSLLVALLWRKKSVILWLGLCLVALLGGIECYQWKIDQPTIQSFNDSGVVEVRGEVIRDPEPSGDTATLVFSAQEVMVDGRWKKASGKILVETAVFPAYGLGDMLEVKGELESLSQIEDQGYRTDLAQQDFSSTLAYPEISFLERGWLFGLRNRLAQSLSSALAEPQASLAQALLLGIRSHVPDSLIEDFYQTGTTHILAISGFNVAIIGGVVLGIGAWLFGRRRPTYLLIALATIWLYASLTGMLPPVLRSTIMFSLFVIALWLGRPGSAMPALALAAAIMVGVKPSVLWDVSFQLSFVSVAGLVLVFPPMKLWEERTIAREHTVLSSVLRPIVVGLAVSLAAIVATLPLVVYYFQSFSPLTLPATLLASLFLPGAIVLSALTAVLGLFVPAVSWVIGWAAWFFLTCMIEVVEGFGSLSFASIKVGPISGIVVLLYYVVLIAVISRKQLGAVMSKLRDWGQTELSKLAEFAYRLPKKWALGILLVAASLTWVAVLATPDRRQLEVSFLDVGQGDAILIETPAGQQILIDGGPDADRVCLELGKNLSFWDKSLDLVVLTHPHDDHVTGLVGVVQRYTVGQVLESGFELDTPAYEEWRRLTEEKDIQRSIARAGQQIDLGEGIRLEIIYPQKEFLEGTESDGNNNSVVLRLVWKEVSFLFTGDIDEEAERAILYSDQWYELDSTVLKIAHHGSSQATSSQSLAAVDPEVAVICVGEGNDFGHPSDETLAKLDGMKLYRTDEQGTINFTTDGEKLWVATER